MLKVCFVVLTACMILFIAGLGIGLLDHLAYRQLGRFPASVPSLHCRLKPQPRPLSGGMVDGVHGQTVGTQAVGDDELGVLHRQLERAAHPSRAAELGKAGKMSGQAEDALDNAVGDGWVDLIIVEPDSREVVTGALMPENLHNAS